MRTKRLHGVGKSVNEEFLVILDDFHVALMIVALRTSFRRVLVAAVDFPSLSAQLFSCADVGRKRGKFLPSNGRLNRPSRRQDPRHTGPPKPWLLNQIQKTAFLPNTSSRSILEAAELT